MIPQHITRFFCSLVCPLCVAVTLVGCGQAQPRESTTPVPIQVAATNNSPIDVCSFFTPQDIEQILGKDYTGKNNSTLSDFVCDYQTANRGNTVSVTVRRLSGFSKASDWYQLLEANKDMSKIQLVAGLGEKAEFIPDSMVSNLAAHQGSIFVFVANSTFEDEKFLTAAKLLVQRVLDRTK